MSDTAKDDWLNAKDIIELKRKVLLNDPAVMQNRREWPYALPVGEQGTPCQQSLARAGKHLLKMNLLYSEYLESCRPDENDEANVGLAPGQQQNGEEEVVPAQEAAGDQEDQDDDEDGGGEGDVEGPEDQEEEEV